MIMPTTLTQQLTTLLSTNPKYVVDGTQLKNKIIEDGLKCDPQLIDLLLSNADIKKHFFMEATGGVLVFNSLKFQQFIGAKDFLPDSFTAYKNKIGLTDGDHYISTNQSVVLDFPYKDCLLEGGQSKDDAKRKEVFWNTTLAPDEIDILLKPKLFTNYQRFTTDKVIDKGLDFESTQAKNDTKNKGQYFHRNEQGIITDNLIIKGNNLLALHSLKAEFKGKVKLIYIDPPYNTGSDSFGYNDRFNHSTWLVFMKNRLEVARELLRDDGVIFVQCDDNEQAYLKVLMDEIFGRENFLSNLIWEKKTGASDAKEIATITEFSILFAKNIKRVCLTKNTNSFDVNRYKYTDKFLEKRGNYYIDNLDRGGLQYSDSLNYGIKCPDGSITFPNGRTEYKNDGWIWKWSEKKVKWGIENDYLEFRQSKSKSSGWSVCYKNYMFVDNENKLIERSAPHKNLISDVLNTHATSEIIELFGSKIFSTPKPEKLLQRIIEMSTNPGDIVLDYHLGSGTTAAVAHKMGRQYIGVEQMDYIQDISCVRMQKVLDGEQGGISKSVNWQGGGSFVYMELRQLNQQFIDQIQSSTTTPQLQDIWTAMQAGGFLSYLISVETINASVSEFEALSFEDQQRFLLEVLDKNNVYICKSDLENEDYVVSEEDKGINREFYKLGK